MPVQSYSPASLAFPSLLFLCYNPECCQGPRPNPASLHANRCFEKGVGTEEVNIATAADRWTPPPPYRQTAQHDVAEPAQCYEICSSDSAVEPKTIKGTTEARQSAWYIPRHLPLGGQIPAAHQVAQKLALKGTRSDMHKKIYT